MHVGQLLAQDQHLLRGQGLQPDDRGQEVAGAGPGEFALRQTGPQGLIAVDAAPLVLDGLGRRAHDDAQILRLALQGVVVHGQHLLIVVLAGDRVWNLVDIDQLIDHDHHTRIARQTEKEGEELEVVVPVVVRDDDVDAQGLPGLPLEGVLAAEPADDLHFLFHVVLHIGVIIHGEELGELKAVHQLADRRRDGVDLLVDGLRQSRVAGRKPRLLQGLRLDGADPPVQDQGQGSALRLCFGRQVTDQLPVGRQSLAPRPLQPPLRRQVRVRHDEAPVHHIVADGLDQEALAGPVAAHNKAEGSSSLRNDVHVVQKRLNLTFAPHCNIGQADPRDHAALE